MNHKADTFAQRDITKFDWKGTDADAGVLTTALCSIIYFIVLCNIMHLQYPGPIGLGVKCSTKFPVPCPGDRSQMTNRQGSPWLASRSPEKYLT